MLRVSQAVVASTNFTKLLTRQTARCLATQAAVKTAEAEKACQKESQSFAMNIFRGQSQISQVFPYPEPMNEDQLENLRMTMESMDKFLTECNDATKSDENSATDPETLKGLWELGCFGLQVPEEYGGIGLTNTQYARGVDSVGFNDLGLGITLGAHQSIGFKGILILGTPEQKKKYLPRVTSGEFAAFCLTEPSCGSDANAVRSRAVKTADGKHYILNGSKIWISNGGIADIMTVFAQTPVKDPKTGQTKDKVTAFIVERSFGGVTSGPPENKMGIKCSNTAEVYFEDVKVPAENIIGEEGQGFKVAMNVLNNGRFGMVTALSGTQRYCIKKAVDHATQRVQFGKTIDQYGTIQEKIARMSILHYVTESMAYMISGNMDKGSQDYHLEAAIAKVFASEAAWWTCDEAIQVLGGMGYMKSAHLERVMRDLRIFRIFEGANDILRLFVALTGIQHAGSQLKELQKALKNPASNFGLIIEEAAKRATRAVGIPINTPSFTHLVDPKLADSAVICAKNIELFGHTIEGILFKYGKEIVDEQFLLQRIAYSAIDLYAMACVLSRATMSAKKNLPSAEHEILMANTWCEEASTRVKFNMKAITTPKFLKTYSNLSKISKNVFKNGDVAHSNPMGF